MEEQAHQVKEIEPQVIDVVVTVDDLVDGSTQRIAYRDQEDVARQASFTIKEGHRPEQIISTSADGISVRLILDDKEDYRVDGDDLHTTIVINDLEATYGRTFTFDTVYGSRTLRILAGTTDGQTSAFEALGLPFAEDNTAGDLVVKWEIEDAPTFDITISAEDLACGFEQDFTVDDVDDDGEDRVINVSVNSGWRPDDELEVNGEYCYVRLKVEESPYYRLDGDHIRLELTLTPRQAALGCTMSLSLPQGDDSIIIDAGTEEGEEIEYEGMGLPGGQESAQGNLYVTARIVQPNTVVRQAVLAVEVEEPGVIATIIRRLASAIFS
jgi:DnaJ-class molecular chaperone